MTFYPKVTNFKRCYFEEMILQVK